MSDLERQIRELAEATAQIRYQFVVAEVQTCFTSLEMARFELSIGNRTVAKREIAAAEKGVQVIERFIGELSPDQQREMGQKLTELKAAIEQLREEIGTTPD